MGIYELDLKIYEYLNPSQLYDLGLEYIDFVYNHMLDLKIQYHDSKDRDITLIYVVL